jgi:lipopolysaccharide export system permease protein
MERPFWGRSSHATVYLYIAKEYLFSFFVAFLFFFAIFFINQLLLLAEEILSKNVALIDVALLVLYSLPAIITFTFPFSSLVGALMAAGRLSADNEILALRAAGISYKRLFLPFAAAGLIFSLVSFVAGDYFLPRGTIAFARLYRDILYSNPALELEPYSVHRYGDTILVTGDVSENGVEDLLIIDSTDDGKRRVIASDRAVLTESGRQSGVVSLRLESVFGHAAASKRKMDYEYFFSRRMEYNILLQSMSFSIHSLTPREMGSIDVWGEIQTKRAALEERRELRKREDAKKRLELVNAYYDYYKREDPKPLLNLSRKALSTEAAYRRPLYDRSLQLHLLEFHKKIAIPFGCLAFVFFAFPLGGIARKTGRSVGFGMGLIVSVFYWALLFAGQTLGLRMSINPSLAMWLPNILIFTAGIILFYFRSRA